MPNVSTDIETPELLFTQDFEMDLDSDPGLPGSIFFCAVAARFLFSLQVLCF